MIATGHLSRDQPLKIGEQVAFAGRVGIVRSIEPLLGDAELHAVVQLVGHEADG